jgi:hypothetical protein
MAVAADAGNHAGEEMPGQLVRRRAEGERIETGNRPRAHGEDVAQNAADPGGRTLIRLDVARMVVAFHLEHDREPVTDIDDACVLARPLDHPRRLRRQRAQMDFRGFVRAMLIPHGRENAEFGDRRLAAHERKNALIFFGREPVRRHQRGADFRPLGGLRPPFGLPRRRLLAHPRRRFSKCLCHGPKFHCRGINAFTRVLRALGAATNDGTGSTASCAGEVWMTRQARYAACLK